MEFNCRRAHLDDQPQILSLYRLVAKNSGGLARRPDEIDSSFVKEIIIESLRTGLMLILEDSKSHEVVGVIHAVGNSVRDLRHVLSQLTFLIHPDLQGRGLGKYLFKCFLQIIKSEFPYIYRVELRARASNVAALGLYESLGFQREGLFRGRIKDRQGKLEDGIPMVWFNSGSAMLTVDQIHTDNSKWIGDFTDETKESGL